MTKQELLTLTERMVADAQEISQTALGEIKDGATWSIQRKLETALIALGGVSAVTTYNVEIDA